MQYPRLVTTVFILLMARPAVSAQKTSVDAKDGASAAKIIKGLEHWTAKQKAAAATFEFVEPRPGAKPLDLAVAIARSFGAPVAVVGDLEGEQEELTLTVGFSDASASTKAAFSPLIRSLIGFAGNDPPLCLAGPKGTIERIGLSPGANSRILELLKVPEASVAPVEQIKVTKNGQDLILDEAALGKELFEAVAIQLRQGRDVKVWLEPRPRRSAVRLKLTTVKGETITFPAEIDGAAQSLAVDDNAKWFIRPGNQSVAVNKAAWGQVLFLWELAGNKPGAQRSHVQLQASTWVRKMPTFERDLGNVHSYQVHAHGKKGLWFGAKPFSVKASMRVRRSFGGCGLHVMIQPEYPEVKLGPMRLTDWAQVSDLTVIDPARQEVRVGYLDAPYCGGAVR
jgi:hypothetical protein